MIQIKGFIIGSLLLPMIACTTSHKASLHGLNQAAQKRIELQACPKSLSLVNNAADSFAFTTSPDVLDIAKNSIDKELSFLSMQPNEADLDLSILKAYVLHLATSKSVVVVLQLRSAMLAKPVILRGSSVGLSWSGSDREYKKSLDDSFKVVLGELKDAINTACKQTVTKLR